MTPSNPPVHARADTAARWALLLGNFVIGTGVLAPAGLSNDLARAFAVDAATVGLLIAYGAAMLCIEAPLFAFLFIRIERRLLLTTALAVYTAGHLASAFATQFEILLAIRLTMIGAAAVYTPQAASSIGLFIAQERRSSAVAFIFMGWSVAGAIGVPLVSFIGAQIGWALAYVALAGASAAAAIGVWLTLPRGLYAPPLSVAAWKKVLSSGKVLLLLAVTSLFIAGQFTQYPFIAAELHLRFDASAALIAGLFAIYGIAGVVGSAIGASIIGRIGAPRTASICLTIALLGLTLWTLGTQALWLATAGLILWGYGLGPSISAQQARLIAADPGVAAASVALNTSVLYAGQALGTVIGGQMLRQGQAAYTGWVGVLLIILALAGSIIARRRHHA